MRHSPASGAIIIMLRSLKMHGMAQAVGELTEQGSPAFEAALPILSQLLKAETADREVRSTAYQLKAARFPNYRDLAGFDFASSEVNEALARQLHRCEFLEDAHNVVLVGGPGTGKTHLATAISVQAIEHHRKRVRFFSTVELVNALEQEKLQGKPGQIAARLTHSDLVILDELGYLPFSASGGALLFHLLSKLYERTSVIASAAIANIRRSPNTCRPPIGATPAGRSTASARTRARSDRRLRRSVSRFSSIDRIRNRATGRVWGSSGFPVPMALSASRRRPSAPSRLARAPMARSNPSSTTILIGAPRKSAPRTERRSCIPISVVRAITIRRSDLAQTSDPRSTLRPRPPGHGQGLYGNRRRGRQSRQTRMAGASARSRGVMASG